MKTIGVWCGGHCLNGTKLLEVVAKHSPEGFHELRIHPYSNGESSYELFPGKSKKLKSVLQSWADRVPRRSLSIVLKTSSFKISKEKLKEIENFKGLGVIEKFEILDDDYKMSDRFI